MNLCKQLEDTPTRLGGGGATPSGPAVLFSGSFFRNEFSSQIRLPSSFRLRPQININLYLKLRPDRPRSSASLTRPFNCACEIKFRLTSILCENS